MRTAKQLQVPQEQYLRFARLRKHVCECFADVEIFDEKAEQCLPEDGVLERFVTEAHHMPETEHFKPHMDGPASHKGPGAKDPGEVDRDVEQGDCDVDGVEEDSELLSEAQLGAEQLIGLDEAHAHDPPRQVAVMRKQLQLLQQETRKLCEKRTEADRARARR